MRLRAALVAALVAAVLAGLVAVTNVGIVEWVWDVTVWLAHGFGSMDYIPIGGYIAAGIWLWVVLIAAVGVLAAVLSLGRSFARGWRTADANDKTTPTQPEG